MAGGHVTSLSIATAARVAPPDPVVELDALAHELEATAARLEAQARRAGWPNADAARGCSQLTAAVERRSCAAA